MKIIDFYTIISKEENRFSQWEKKIKLFKKKSKDTYSFLPSQPYVFPVTDRVKPEIVFCSYGQYKGTLSAEQEYITNIIKSRWNDYSYGCGLINMKTGRGKSHVIMAITSFYNTRTLVLCHNIKTLHEMVGKFTKFMGYEPGIIGDGNHKIKDITVCTHDSFLTLEDKFDLIIYDECDYNVSKSMIEALCVSDAKLLYGLTGTPYRKDLDNKDLQKLYGKQIEWTEVTHNIIPEVVVLKYRSDTFKDYEYENWAENKSCLVNDTKRMYAQAAEIHDIIKHRKLILILSERVEEAENLYDILTQSCEFDTILVTGKTKDKDDNTNIKAITETGGVIIGTIGKMARGVDIPMIDTICLFASIHFQGTVVQAVGRALRQCDGKTDVLIVDWSDLPILYQQHYQRRKAYEKEYGLTSKQIKQYDLGKDRIDWKDPTGVRLPVKVD